MANANRKGNRNILDESYPGFKEAGLKFLMEQVVPIVIPGNIADSTSYGHLKFPFDAAVVAIEATAGTAPATSSIDIVVEDDGLATVQALDGLIAAAAVIGHWRYGGSDGIPAVRIEAGHVISIGTTGVGTGTLGADVTFTLHIRPL